MGVIGRGVLFILGFILIMLGMSMIFGGIDGGRAGQIMAFVISALGVAVIVRALLPGTFALEGSHPLLAKLNLNITGPAVVFFLTLFIMLAYLGEGGSSPGFNTTNDAGTIPQNVLSQPIMVESYCSATGVYGYGSGANFDIAAEMAVRDCVYNGGYPDCCPRNLRQVSN